MDEEREPALRLACECASMDGDPGGTIARARAYLSFLNGEGVTEAVIADRRSEVRPSSNGERHGF